VADATDERKQATETEATRLDRRELLRRAGVGAAALTVGGVAAPYSFAGPLRFKDRQLKGDLSIIQWIHFVPAYDTWFDNTWVKQWGEKNDVQVKVDHINNTQLDATAAAEVAAQSGHDLFQNLHPMASYEDQVINHAAIVHEVERKVGPYGDLGKRSTYNPKTNKYFAVSDNYVPDPVIWRHDLWNGVGESPATWEHVLRAAPKLKAAGHPIGIGQSQELDSDMALIAFLMCFGSFIQNAENRPTLKSKQTVDAVKFMTQIYKSGELPEIFSWNPASNNQGLYSGHLALILNAISATRTPEQLNLPFANDLWIWPIPAGPHGRYGLEHVMGSYSIWKFAKNKENAERFLADLCINYREATMASQLYNFPSFPGAFPFPQIRKAAAADKHKPLGKYTILTTIAQKYTHNIGYPGTTNAAVDEIFSSYLIPQMFAQVAQGKLSAADSVSAVDKQARAIFAKWRARGKI
jgi:multiple sugar transport system substrate-binding protein